MNVFPRRVGKLVPILLFALFAANSQQLAAQTNTWTGAVSTDWASAGNWSAGVPNSTDSVVIPATSRKPVSAGASIRTLTILSGAGLTLNGVIYVDGATKQSVLNYGTLTIQSGGGITVGRYSQGGTVIGIDSRSGSVITNSGSILINDVGIGMRLEGTLFTNKGSINIGTLSQYGPIKTTGLWVINAPDSPDNLFSNEAGNSIQIDNVGSTAILNSSNFQNKGSITIGNTSIGSYGLSNSSAFTNTGSLTIKKTGDAAIRTTGGTLANTGSISLNPSDNSGTLYSATAGSFNNNAGGNLNGTGILSNRFINTGGTLSPGYSPGIMTFAGDESFTGGGKLAMEINGAGTAGVNYDQVVVNGKLTLGDTLSLAINYAGSNGQQIPLLTANEITGTFAKVSGLQPNWYINYTSQAVYLVYCNTSFSFYNVTGSGTYACGGAGLAVGLSGSQTGVNYQLRKDGVNLGTPKAGTGSALSFGIQIKGTYTVMATFASGGCAALMPGNALIIEGCTASALNFDGTNDYVSLPNSLAAAMTADTALTIEYWFKGSVLSSAVRVQTSAGYIASAFGGKHIISTDGGAAGVAVGAAAIDGEWHHVAMTWQKNTENGFKSYLDGVLVEQRNSANANLPVLTSGLTLGSRNGSADFLNGSLDEVRIWKIARSQCDIQNNMTCGVTGGQPGLLAYYKFNQGIIGVDNSGVNSLADSSGNAYTGTLTNFALTGTASTWVAPGGIGNGITCSGFNTWLGLSANWNAPTNWSGGFVPTACTKVIINGGVPFMPLISGNSNSCYSIALNNGATIQLGAGATLSVTGKQ